MRRDTYLLSGDFWESVLLHLPPFIPSKISKLFNVYILIIYFLVLLCFNPILNEEFLIFGHFWRQKLVCDEAVFLLAEIPT